MSRYFKITKLLKYSLLDGSEFNFWILDTEKLKDKLRSVNKCVLGFNENDCKKKLIS